MADYGTVKLADPDIALNVTNYTLITQGVNFPVNKVYNLFQKNGIVPPKLGQIWPRQMWHYNDRINPPSSSWGSVKLFVLVAYGTPYIPITNGQLWPRGDYVANETVNNG